MTDFKSFRPQEQEYLKSLLDNPNLLAKLRQDRNINLDTLLLLKDDISEYYIWKTVFELNPKLEDIIVYQGAELFASPIAPNSVGYNFKKQIRFFQNLDQIQVVIVNPIIPSPILRQSLEQALSITPSISLDNINTLLQGTDSAQLLSATITPVGFVKRRLDLKVKLKNFTIQFYFFISFSDSLDLSVEKFKESLTSIQPQRLSYAQLGHKTYELGKMEQDRISALKFHQINLADDGWGYSKTYKDGPPPPLSTERLFESLMFLSKEANTQLLFSPSVKLDPYYSSEVWIEVYPELKWIVLNFKNPSILDLSSRKEQQNWYLIKQSPDGKQTPSTVSHNQVPISNVAKIYLQKQALGKVLVEARSLTQTMSDQSKQQYTHRMSELLFSAFLVSIPREALPGFKKWTCTEMDAISKTHLDPMDMDTLQIWISPIQRFCFSKFNLNEIISNVKDNNLFVLPLPNGSSYKTWVYKTRDYLADNNLLGFKLESWVGDELEFTLIPIFSTWQNTVEESIKNF